MSIKARNNTSSDAVCCECGASQSSVLNMFDFCVGGRIFTICDECNRQLLNKSLFAECYKNGRVKSSKDLSVIRRRRDGTYKEAEGNG